MYEAFAGHTSQDPKPLADACPELYFPEQISRTIMRCLSKDPANRFHDCSELKHALQLGARGEADRSATGLPAATLKPSRQNYAKADSSPVSSSANNLKVVKIVVPGIAAVALVTFLFLQHHRHTSVALIPTPKAQPPQAAGKPGEGAKPASLATQKPKVSPEPPATENLNAAPKPKTTPLVHDTKGDVTSSPSTAAPTSPVKHPERTAKPPRTTDESHKNPTEPDKPHERPIASTAAKNVPGKPPSRGPRENANQPIIAVTTPPKSEPAKPVNQQDALKKKIADTRQRAELASITGDEATASALYKEIVDDSLQL